MEVDDSNHEDDPTPSQHEPEEANNEQQREEQQSMTETETSAVAVLGQEDKAVSRERFIRFMLALQHKQVDFEMYQDTRVSATFEGTDSGMEQIAVSGLVTPIAVYNTALLRSSDLISFSVDIWGPLC